MKCIIQNVECPIIVEGELRAFAVHPDAGNVITVSVSGRKYTGTELQHSQNLGNHTRNITDESITHVLALSGSHHRSTVLRRLRAEREVGPRAGYATAFHRSNMKVCWTVIRRRFAVSKVCLEYERLDTSWVAI